MTKSRLTTVITLTLIHLATVSISFAASNAKPQFGAAVSTSSPEATQVAIDILKSGGNAVDAACAAVFALNVTQPHFSGMGGGGFALIHQNGKADVFLDFRESAPESATSRLFYESESNNVIAQWRDRNTGARAVGVPGVVAGCGQAVKESGILPWRKVLEPSILLARKGFRISQFFQEELSDQWERISPFEFTKLLLKGPGGNGLRNGDHFSQPLLANTLEMLAKEGPEDFYSGELAKKWLKEAQSFGVQFTQRDLESYRVIRRDLISFDVGKYHGVTASAPSSAGLMVAAVLRYLNHYYSQNSIPHISSLERNIVTVEAKAFFGKERNKAIADPTRMSFKESDFLNSHQEADAWKHIDENIRLKLSKLAVSHSASEFKSDVVMGLDRLETHTAHVSVVDHLGNAVALTSSVGNIYGSGIILPESGFVLNSTLGDFNPSEDQLNSPAPLVRPLSNMSPLFFYEGRSKDETLVGVMGAAGGSLIPSGIVDFVENYYRYQLDKDQAIRFPRVHSEDGVEVAIEKHTTTDLKKLERIGYQVQPIETVWAVFEGVVRKTAKQNWEAVAETRYDGLGLTFF